MKQKEYLILLELLDSDTINEAVWKTFSDPQEAKSKYLEFKFLHEHASIDDPGFSPFFKEKIMTKVYELVKTPSLDEILSRLMNKVMLAGTLTILIVMLLLYVYHGQFGVDTLTGIDQDTEFNFISSVFNEY